MSVRCRWNYLKMHHPPKVHSISLNLFKLQLYSVQSKLVSIISYYFEQKSNILAKIQNLHSSCHWSISQVSIFFAFLKIRSKAYQRILHFPSLISFSFSLKNFNPFVPLQLTLSSFSWSYLFDFSLFIFYRACFPRWPSLKPLRG